MQESGVSGSAPHSGERLRRQYSFGDFTLDIDRRVLRRGNEEVPLRPKSLDVLIHLVDHHGHVVTKAALMEAVWGDTAITENSLPQCLVEIRRALHDDSQQMIRTVSRRGYLFAAPVTTPVLEFPHPAPVAPAEPGPRRRVWVALLLLLLAAGFFAWRAWRATERGDPLRAVPLSALPGAERYPSFSPDGNHVAFTWTGPRQDNQDVYVQQIGSSGPPLPLTTDPRMDYNPVWSPDGRWIAFLRRQWEAGTSELRLIRPLGGPEQKVAEIHLSDTYYITPPYMAWCPDSNCLVVTDSPGQGKPAALFLVSRESGEKSPLTHPQFPAIADTNPALSPDGSSLVFRRQTSLHNGELYRLPLARGPTSIGVGEPRRLTEAALDAGYPIWVPAGNKEILFSARGSLWRLIVPGKHTPARLPFAGEDGIMPAVSRFESGRARLIYVRNFQDTNIWRVEVPAPGAPATAPPEVAISSARRDSTPQLSPDGRRVAFPSDRSGAWEIWLADPDGSNAVRLTFMGAAGAPCWSPDGERIVFQSNREGQYDVNVIRAAGGKPQNLTSHAATDFRPSFSRDGQWIYFTSNRTGQNQIWKMPASGGAASPVTSNGAFAAFESPDGAWLYYNQTMETPSPLWRQSVSGGAPMKVLDGVVRAAFTVLDGGIYYIDRPSAEGGLLFVDQPSGETRLQYFDIATRRTTTVARNLGNVYLGLTASRDGRTIFYSRVDSSVDELMLVENFR
jgi:Tol biopolymer transport system component/DNA-binding winged helix-turn-helix (wHTH) protein